MCCVSGVCWFGRCSKGKKICPSSMFCCPSNMFYGISPVNVLHAPLPEGPPLTACLLRNKKSQRPKSATQENLLKNLRRGSSLLESAWISSLTQVFSSNTLRRELGYLIRKALPAPLRIWKNRRTSVINEI